MDVKGDFIFQYNYNKLTLKAGSLSYVPNRQYQIYVSTFYLDTEYYQNVIIDIENTNTMPIAIIE